MKKLFYNNYSKNRIYFCDICKYEAKLCPLQKDLLEEYYLKDNFPKKYDINKISNILFMKTEEVELWFMKRRELYLKIIQKLHRFNS